MTSYHTWKKMGQGEGVQSALSSMLIKTMEKSRLSAAFGAVVALVRFLFGKTDSFFLTQILVVTIRYWQSDL